MNFMRSAQNFFEEVLRGKPLDLEICFILKNQFKHTLLKISMNLNSSCCHNQSKR